MSSPGCRTRSAPAHTTTLIFTFIQQNKSVLTFLFFYLRKKNLYARGKLYQSGDVYWTKHDRKRTYYVRCTLIYLRWSTLQPVRSQFYAYHNSIDETPEKPTRHFLQWTGGHGLLIFEELKENYYWNCKRDNYFLSCLVNIFLKCNNVNMCRHVKYPVW